MLRDGVGTATFYEPETKSFCALGHAITDTDTGEIVNIANIKGKRGTPGQIKGSIESTAELGSIEKNTAFGIYGKIKNLNKLDVTSRR